MPAQTALAPNYYALLGLSAEATTLEIRRAYRELSKRYHPDTTALPAAVATEKFQQLNQAYATLSNPENRQVYDQKLRALRQNAYRSAVMPLSGGKVPVSRPPVRSSSAYLDPTERPLSAGEIFALFIMGLTLLACLLLAIAIGLTRGDLAFQPGSLKGVAPVVEKAYPPIVIDVNSTHPF